MWILYWSGIRFEVKGRERNIRTAMGNGVICHSRVTCGIKSILGRV